MPVKISFAYLSRFKFKAGRRTSGGSVGPNSCYYAINAGYYGHVSVYIISKQQYSLKCTMSQS